MMAETDILSLQAQKAQQTASDPQVSAWVSASAGSGKTKVLIDRILRLLLNEVEPEKILCLTYTKAAAAEMKNRLTQTLKKWVLMDDVALQQQLSNLMELDAKSLPKYTDYARTLFAKLLEVKGGFKMMTIHSFCESLLRRFPLEAGISPSFEIIEENDAKMILHDALLSSLAKKQFAQDLLTLSEYTGEKNLLSLFAEIQKSQSKIEQLLSHMSFESVKDKIYSVLGVSPQQTEESLKRAVCPDGNFDEVRKKYLKKDGDVFEKILNSEDADKIAFAKRMSNVVEQIKALNVARATCALIHIILDVFQQFNLVKQNKGALDYTDLIEKTNSLLSNNATTAWVLYKLDGGIDHILLDEAQDTSPEQWQIIKAITEEFFSGIGQKEDRLRTLFVVGDKKQSIYRFQGADAKEFEKMQNFFAERIPQSNNLFENVRLNISFRSTQPVLDLVNLLLQNPAARQGVASINDNVKHVAYRSGQAGLVEIWPLEISTDQTEKTDVWQIDDLIKTQTPTVKKLSQKIAAKIRNMLETQEILPSVNRPIKPSDIMILVRSRTRQGIVEELLKALKEQNVPVCGIDRLILNKHIAIQDLMSLGSFLLLPDDDLSLAEVLKSPLFSVTEDELFELAANRADKTLWASVAAHNTAIYNILKDLLSKTDLLMPFELYSYILDVLGFRKNFLAYMGQETNEMLDEFLNLCLKFEQNNSPSLENFLQFMKQEDIQIKRDLDNAQIDAVRIMTVHGSKGLQSKIVFIPDAYSKTVDAPNFVWKNNMPFWIPNAQIRTNICKQILQDIQSDEDDEYNRLLYVALTRAEDRLYICGFKNKKAAPSNNWYDMIKNSVDSYNPTDGATFTSAQTAKPKEEKSQDNLKPFIQEAPNWFDLPAIAEPVPSKPLSPSKLTEDTAAPSPLTPEQEKAMERGSFIHKLLQYLPTIPSDQRKDFVLQHTPAGMDIPQQLFKLMNDPQFNDLFCANSEAEVPVVGITQDGKVICGQIDRLVIREHEVLIVDYKTNRYPPKTKENIPLAYIEQLNAYKDLLKNLFPDKKIRSFLLWTTDVTMTEI